MVPQKTYAKTLTELGVAIGRSLSTVVQYKGEGAPVRKSKRGYRIAPVLKWIKENRKQSPGKRASKARKKKGDPEPETDWEELYSKERALKTKAERERAELRQRIESGEYIPMAEVRERDAARISAVKSGLLSMPRRLAQDVSGLTLRQTEAVIAKRVRDLLERFSRM